MFGLYRSFRVVALISMIAACGAVRAENAGKAEPPRINPQAATLQDFHARVTKYLELRKVENREAVLFEVIARGTVDESKAQQRRRPYAYSRPD